MSSAILNSHKDSFLEFTLIQNIEVSGVAGKSSIAKARKISMLYSCMSLNKLIAVMNYHPRTQARVIISLQSGRNYFCACESFGGKTTILLSPPHSPHGFVTSPLLLLCSP